MAQTSYFFTGGADGSFLSNHYVIYRKKELGPDAPKSNPYALKQGITYINRMLFDRSDRSNSSFSLFCEYIKNIATQQREQEKRYLQVKLDQLKSDKKIGNKQNTEQIISIIESVIDQDPIEQLGGYSTAFTALLRYEQNLKEVARQLSKENSSITKLNSLYQNRFELSMKKELAKHIQASIEEGVKLVDFDIDKFIEIYIKKTAGDKLTELESKSLDGWRKNIKSFLLTKFNKYNIEIPKKLSDLINKSNKDKKINDDWFKYKSKKRVRSSEALASMLLKGVGYGLGEQLKDIKMGKVVGSTGINTANIIGENLRKTTSNIIIDGATAEVDIGKIANEIFIENGGIFPKTEEEFNNFLIQIEEKVRKAGVKELFELHIRAKEYISNRNLSVLGPGSFENTLRRLNNMSNKISNKNLSPIAIDGNYFDKLIFLLLNTTEGTIADKYIDQIKLNIAAIFATWVWSDYKEVLKSDIPTLGVNRIHLFDQGGAYYTASEMVGQVYNELINHIKFSEVSSFVSVNLRAPDHFSTDIYSSWINATEDTTDWDFSIRSAKKDADGNADYNDVQKILEKRWNYVRAEALKTGKLGITFKQKELEKLLSQLGPLIGVK